MAGTRKQMRASLTVSKIFPIITHIKEKLTEQTKMHDIWNPWHGCKKCSEGCQNCYMYYLDGLRGQSGADIYRTKAGFRYPLSKDREGRYKVKSGEMIRVCMTSDFFLAEADPLAGGGMGDHPSTPRCQVLPPDQAARARRGASALGLGRWLGERDVQRHL